MIERKPCPRCGCGGDWGIPMRFIFPAQRTDPAIDAIIGRFQKCNSCSWTGDALTGTEYQFKRESNRFYVNGVYCAGDIDEWAKSLNLTDQDAQP